MPAFIREDTYDMRLRVGLTGGIGTGKSEVARMFAAFGALVIDADALARDAVAPGGEALARIAELFPTAIATDGSLDRSALARIVFHDADARDAVGAIVHPIVRGLGAERERGATPEQIVVHDVPLLFEAGFYRQCDANVVVVADEHVRFERLAARSGFDDDEIRRRMRVQIDPDRARELADYTIVNDGSLDDLHAQASDVFEDISLRRAVRKAP